MISSNLVGCNTDRSARHSSLAKRFNGLFQIDLGPVGHVLRYTSKTKRLAPRTSLLDRGFCILEPRQVTTCHRAKKMSRRNVGLNENACFGVSESGLELLQPE